MEDPALAKGLVKRSVIRVITPGTVMESSMLDAVSYTHLDVYKRQAGARCYGSQKGCRCAELGCRCV